jgi:hypothetical protein
MTNGCGRMLSTAAMKVGLSDVPETQAANLNDK